MFFFSKNDPIDGFLQARSSIIDYEVLNTINRKFITKSAGVIKTTDFTSVKEEDPFPMSVHCIKLNCIYW